ncbi:MAG: histidine triad nucleotide-binding protein [Actinobacteria bacterium]|nr:histidine triad nucleotide-binding protein [Actinomycetota bacterium]
MADCIFCRIVTGDVPSDHVAATDHAFAFRDLNPVAPTHILVVPRRHIDHAASLRPDDQEILSDMFGLANEVASSEGLADRGYRLVFNVGDDAGNSVSHLHLHVIGGRSMSWPPG